MPEEKELEVRRTLSYFARKAEKTEGGPFPPRATLVGLFEQLSEDYNMSWEDFSEIVRSVVSKHIGVQN